LQQLLFICSKFYFTSTILPRSLFDIKAQESFTHYILLYFIYVLEADPEIFDRGIQTCRVLSARKYRSKRRGPGGCWGVGWGHFEYQARRGVQTAWALSYIRQCVYRIGKGKMFKRLAPG
jgi:hypothetical protein